MNGFLALAGLAAIAVAAHPRGAKSLMGIGDWWSDQGFTETMEWEDLRFGARSMGRTALVDNQYTSKIKDIREACSRKKRGEYGRVWITDRHGRREICR